MINPTSIALLFIEPQCPKSEQPIVDELTQKMVAAFTDYKTGTLATDFTQGAVWHGVHQCTCGAHSTAFDYLLPSGFVTNSLCVHYLAWHRNEVPQAELDKVASLPNEYANPTTQVLQ